MRFLALFLIIAGSLFGLNAFSPGHDKQAVTPEELKSWINYLASDEMHGRANGSVEMKSAAAWLSDQFREYGIQPLLPSGDYIQYYSFTSRQSTINERNVIGVIEGTNPALKDQFIILSAHFDHIGIRKGNESDSIYNGADDNAAGTCTLIGIAKAIKEKGLQPGRTLIFAAFSGEERGMRGSRYFVENSPVLLKNVVADINFEMTGHSEYLGRKRYYMTGCKISNLDDIIGEYNKRSDWKLIDTIAIADRLFFASDNISFSRISSADGVTRGIPSGTFATTAEADYIHSPHDEGELFDYDNMADLVDHFSNLIIWLSETKSEIQFSDPSFKVLN